MRRTSGRTRGDKWRRCRSGGLIAASRKREDRHVAPILPAQGGQRQDRRLALERDVNRSKVDELPGSCALKRRAHEVQLRRQKRFCDSFARSGRQEVDVLAVRQRQFVGGLLLPFENDLGRDAGWKIAPSGTAVNCRVTHRGGQCSTCRRCGGRRGGWCNWRRRRGRHRGLWGGWCNRGRGRGGHRSRRGGRRNVGCRRGGRCNRGRRRGGNRGPWIWGGRRRLRDCGSGRRLRNRS